MKIFPWQKPLRGSKINWSHPLSRGLIGCWLLNEGTGGKAFDLSGYGNHGTLNAGSTWGRNVIKVSDAADGGVAVGDILDKYITRWITVEALVTITMAIDDPDHDYTRIFADYSVGGDYRIMLGFGDLSTNEALRWTVYTTTGLENIYGTTIPVNGGVYHVVGTYNGRNTHLYVNGIEENSTSQTGNLRAGTTSCVIGNENRSDPDDRPWVGDIIYCRVYNRALYPEEVFYLYQYPYAMFTRPTIGFGIYQALPIAWGEESPTGGETARSWTNWSDGSGGVVTVEGDSDWGQLRIGSGQVAHSPVVTNNSGNTRAIKVSEDLYGSSGSGDFNVYVRGQSTSFGQDDASPSWESYSATVDKNWKYMQVKLEKA